MNSKFNQAIKYSLNLNNSQFILQNIDILQLNLETL